MEDAGFSTARLTKARAASLEMTIRGLVEGEATTLRFRLERIGIRGLIVTLGILRCAQNDGKDSSQ
jgi:hypothetical protein